MKQTFRLVLSVSLLRFASEPADFSSCCFWMSSICSLPVARLLCWTCYDTFIRAG